MLLELLHFSSMNLGSSFAAVRVSLQRVNVVSHQEERCEHLMLPLFPLQCGCCVLGSPKSFGTVALQLCSGRQEPFPNEM